MHKMIVAMLSAGCLIAAPVSASANTINGIFAATVDRNATDTLNLFGLGSSTNVNGQAISGSFSYDIGALSAVSVTNNAGGTAGQTDYNWINSTGAISLSVTTGTTTTTVTSTISGGVRRADRNISGIYQLFEVYANDGTNHIEEYFVSPIDFLDGFGVTIPDYVFALPSGGAHQYGESYLTVGSEQIVSIVSTVQTSEVATPEPGTVPLIGAGLFAVAFMRSRRSFVFARR